MFVTVTATPNPGAGIEIFFEEFCDGVSRGAAAIDPPGPTDAMGAMRGGGLINCAPGEEFRATNSSLSKRAGYVVVAES